MSATASSLTCLPGRPWAAGQVTALIWAIVLPPHSIDWVRGTRGMSSTFIALGPRSLINPLEKVSGVSQSVATSAIGGNLCSACS